MNKIFGLACLMLIAVSIQAQTFSSGSTGADGALDLSSGSRQVDLPESGILNYTTVNIPRKILTFRPNLRNTPVILLTQGAVTVNGAIVVSAPSHLDGTVSINIPGPGGYYGAPSGGLPGFGPGGGIAFSAAIWVGPLSLVPIVGGSGGGSNNPGDGGGGGGAIVIASSTSISILSANLTVGEIDAEGIGRGSGGAIRLVSNSINISGNLSAGNGVIRLEAPANALFFTGRACQ